MYAADRLLTLALRAPNIVLTEICVHDRRVCPQRLCTHMCENAQTLLGFSELCNLAAKCSVLRDAMLCLGLNMCYDVAISRHVQLRFEFLLHVCTPLQS
jgi:hypothetical protein